MYQQYCNRSSTGKTYQDLYNDIHDLVKYDGDGIKSSTARDSDIEDSDESRSTKESSRSSNSHSSRRNQQIAAAANYLTQQQVASNSAANDTKSSHQASPAAIHQAPGKEPSRHARTARAPSISPSATNPTASTGREEVITQERPILAGSQVLQGQPRPAQGWRGRRR